MSHNPYDAGHQPRPDPRTTFGKEYADLGSPVVSEMFRLRGEVERQAEELTRLRGEVIQLRVDLANSERRRKGMDAEIDAANEEVLAAERRVKQMGDALVELRGEMPATCTCDAAYSGRHLADPSCGYHDYGAFCLEIIGAALASPAPATDTQGVG